MSTTTHATEVLLRINLNSGLSEAEVERLAVEAKASGGLDKAVLSAIRKGLRSLGKPARKGVRQ